MFSILSLCQIEGIKYFLEVLDPFKVDFCTVWKIIIYFYCSMCSYLVLPSQFVASLFFSPVSIGDFLVKNQVVVKVNILGSISLINCMD